jgi:Domain of unknown function (DUF4129)
VGTRIVVAAIALTLLIGIVAVAGREPLRDTAGEPRADRQAPGDVTRMIPKRKGPLPPEVFIFLPDEESSLPAWLLWTVAGIALAAVAIGALVQFRQHRPWGAGRRRADRTAPRPEAAEPPGVSTPDDAEVARRAVDEALASLRYPTNPRSAVIAAYARMEQVLAERELGRRKPEAPREYLARVLREQGMPERSLTTVTALFEEARFSLHPIPDSAPRRALSALENAQLALERRIEGTDVQRELVRKPAQRIAQQDRRDP